MSRNSDITEQDYLDLVEGRLPSDRVEVMRAALRADPVLARRLKAMVADRERIHQMTSDDQRSAPAGLVGAAVTRAERDTLLAPGVGRATPARRRTSRNAALIALALILGAGLAGSAIYLSSSPKSSGAQLASSPPKPRASAPGGVFEVPTEDLDARAGAPPLPDLLGSSEAHPSAAPTRPAPARSIPDGAPPTAPLPGIASSHDQVARWNREVAEKIAGEADQAQGKGNGLRRNAPDAIVGGMPLSEAAKLAMEGHLRIITHPTASASALRLAQASAALGAGIGKVVDQSSPTSFTVELTTRYDPSLEALQDAIAALVERLAGDSFTDRAVVRLSAAPEGTAGTAPAITSFRAEDVLWWVRPVSTWERAVSVRAPVEVVPVPE